MSTERINGISLLRVIMMLVVVFYHCLCGFGRPWSWNEETWYGVVPIWDEAISVIKCFHMPIFVVISGYLFEYKKLGGGYSDFLKFSKTKILRVLLPYLVWGTIVCLLFEGHWSDLAKGISHLWFLLFIFEAYISFYFIDKIFSRKNAWWILTIALLSNMGGVAVLKNFLPLKFLGMGNYLVFMPYYIAGAYLAKFPLHHKMQQSLTIFLLCTMVFVITFITLNHEKHFIMAIPSALLVISMFLVFLSANPNRLPIWVQNLDKCSMGIYIVHHLIIEVLNGSRIIHPLMSHYYVYPLALFFVTTVLSWGFVSLGRQFKVGKLLLG